jgi:hypothetical protein
MGTWGAGIFDNDEGSDLLEAWKELRAARVPAQTVSQRIAERFALDPKAATASADLWLALASLQAQSKVLQDDVKQRALEIIDSPEEEKRWAESNQFRRRKKALAMLRARLEKKPAAPDAPAKAKAEQLAPGDVVAYRLPDERVVLFRAFRSAESAKLVTFELLDFIGKEPPADPGALRGRLMFPEAHAERIQSGKKVLELIDVFQTFGFARLSAPATAARVEPRLERVASGLPADVGYPFHQAATLSGGYAAKLDELVTDAFTEGNKRWHPWTEDAIARAEKLAAQQRALDWPRCEKCGWTPTPSATFECASCRHVAPLFETGGRCPKCKKVEPARCLGGCAAPTVRLAGK